MDASCGWMGAGRRRCSKAGQSMRENQRCALISPTPPGPLPRRFSGLTCWVVACVCVVACVVGCVRGVFGSGSACAYTQQTPPTTTTHHQLTIPTKPTAPPHPTPHLQQLEDQVRRRVPDEVRHVEAPRQRAPEGVPGVPRQRLEGRVAHEHLKDEDPQGPVVGGHAGAAAHDDLGGLWGGCGGSGGAVMGGCVGVVVGLENGMCAAEEVRLRLIAMQLRDSPTNCSQAPNPPTQTHDPPTPITNLVVRGAADGEGLLSPNPLCKPKVCHFYVA